jgi:hypothetical protein
MSMDAFLATAVERGYMKSSRKSSSRSWLLDSARLSSVMISS